MDWTYGLTGLFCKYRPRKVAIVNDFRSHLFLSIAWFQKPRVVLVLLHRTRCICTHNIRSLFVTYSICSATCSGVYSAPKEPCQLWFQYSTVQYLEIFVEISCFPIFTSGSRTSHEGFWSSAQNMTFSHSKLCGRPKRIMTASSTQWDEESKQQSRQRDVPKKKELPYKQSWSESFKLKDAATQYYCEWFVISGKVDCIIAVMDWARGILLGLLLTKEQRH